MGRVGCELEEVAAECSAAPVVVAEVRPSAAPVDGRAGRAARFGTLLTSHTVIDVFPILFSSLLWPLQSRLDLTSSQVTAVIMATPIFSGLLQPLAAWLTDKHDTRLFGPLGLAVGAVCIGSIGLAQSFWQLIMLQLVGVIATGMYHPIATALAGQSGSRLLKNGRAQAIGLFICAGMLGHAIGAELGPVLNARFGMEALLWLVPPALVVAVVMHVLLRNTRHRHDNHREMHAELAPGEAARRWRTVGILAGQNALRFTVNVGLLAVMLNVWAKSKVVGAASAAEGVSASSLLKERAVSEAASLQVGHLSVAMTAGMGLGVILTGRYVKRGRERAPLVYLSLVGAVFTAILGHVGDGVFAAQGGFSGAGMALVYLCVALTATGFFATFPIATSLAQRLIPGQTSLVTSLMMGMGWAIAAVCVPLSYLFFGMVPVDEAPALEAWRVNMGFYGFAALLLVAGVSTLAIPRDLVERVADHH